MDTSERVAGHYEHFLEEFKRIADVTVHVQSREGMTPSDFQVYCLKTNKKPLNDLSLYKGYDIVIIFNPFVFVREQWDKVNCPKIVVLEDQHGNNNRRQIEFAFRHNALLLHRYLLKDFNADILDKVRRHKWFPHSVNTDIFKEYDLNKKYMLLQTGAMWAVYRTRNILKNYFTNNRWDQYKYILRPKTNSSWPCGADYARLINQSYFTVCCGGDVEYTVMKYFEIPAAGGIIYGDLHYEAKQLGFEHMKNMIEVDFKSPRKQIESLVRDKDLIGELVYNGQMLIHDYYTNKIRALELYEVMKGLCVDNMIAPNNQRK